MPIYIANRAAEARHVPILFMQEGANTHVPSRISDVPIFGLPHIRELAFDGYTRNFDSFVAASIRKTRLTTIADSYDRFIPDKFLPLPFPALSFSLRGRPSEDDVTSISNRLKDPSIEVLGKRQVITVQSYGIRTVESLLRITDDAYNKGQGTLSPRGAQAALYISFWLQSALGTHSYAAFPKEGLEVPVYTGYDVVLHHTNDARTATYGRTKKRAAMWSSASEKRTSALGVDKTRWDYVDAKHGEVDASGTEMISTTAFDAVSIAKPSPVDPSTNIGNATQIPVGPGIVFPYFRGLNNPDHKTIKESIFELFFRLMGDSLDSCKDFYASLKRGIQSLATTDFGMALAHILTGLKLALDTQARLFVVIDGQDYQGFVLCGTKFSVYDGSEWICSGDAASLQADVAKLNPHIDAVDKLAVLLSACTMRAGGMEIQLTRSDLSNFTLLRRELTARDIPDRMVADIDEQLHRLAYPGTSFRQSAPGTVLGLLESLAGTNVPDPDEDRMYIVSCRDDFHDRIYQWFSTFGKESVSFWSTVGTEIPIEVETEPVPSGGGKRKAGDEKVPDEIIVLPKPLKNCVLDWETVVGRKHVRWNLKERAKAYRTIMIRDVKMKAKVWKALFEAVGTNQTWVEGRKGATKVEPAKKAETEKISLDDLVFD